MQRSNNTWLNPTLIDAAVKYIRCCKSILYCDRKSNLILIYLSNYLNMGLIQRRNSFWIIIISKFSEKSLFVHNVSTIYQQYSIADQRIAFLRFNMESSNNMMSHYDILRLIVSRFIFFSFPRWKLFLGQYFIAISRQER